MTKCERCNQDTATATGCVYNVVYFADSTRLPALPHEGDVICQECNAEPGTFHHAECNAEKCPRCHKQMLTCDCALYGEQRRQWKQMPQIVTFPKNYGLVDTPFIVKATKCNRCKFWHTKGGAPDEPPTDGECRRRPPKAFKTMNVRSGYDTILTRWPITKAEDWCGDGQEE